MKIQITNTSIGNNYLIKNFELNTIHALLHTNVTYTLKSLKIVL